jgi:hypothetical protein
VEASLSKSGRLVTSVFVPLFVGCVVFFNVVRQPGFDAVRSVDVLRLVASGMCLGVALVSIIAFFRAPRNG